MKRLMADLSLDKHMLSKALRKKVYGPHAAKNWLVGFKTPSRSVACKPVFSHSSVVLPGIDAVERTISPRYACAFAIWLMLAPALAIVVFGYSCVRRAGW